MNDGAVRLKALGLSLGKIAEELGKLGLTVTKMAVSRWIRGERVPTLEARAVLEKPPFGIDPKAWDSAAGPAGAKKARAPAPPSPPSAPAGAVANAPELAQDLLTRIQRWREQSEVDGTPAAQAQLAALEMRAIQQLAGLTGQAAAPEAELVRSPAWKKLKAELLGALERFPDALAAVVQVLGAT